MAVVDEDAAVVIDVLAGEGQLEITYRCVVLRRASDALTLVWRRPDVVWTGSTILFRRGGQGDLIRLESGMFVKVAGFPTDEYARWITPAAAECPKDVVTVHDVTPVSEESINSSATVTAGSRIRL